MYKQLHRRALTLLMAGCLLITPAMTTSADVDRPLKVSGDLVVTTSPSRVASLTADRETIIFMARPEAGTSSIQLYAAPFDASRPPIQLSTQFNPSYIDYRIQDHANRLVYSTGAHVYSSDLTTGAEVQLDSGATSGGYGLRYLVSPDQTFLLFHKNAQGPLYRVPLSGGTPEPIGPTIPTGRSLGSFRLLNDNNTLVFLADLDTVGVLDLYRTTLSGSGAPVRLNAVSVGPTGIQRFFETPDGQKWILDTNLNAEGARGWYALPAGGGTPVAIYQDEVPGASVRPLTAQFTPDGQTLLFGVGCPPTPPVSGECAATSTGSELQAVLAWPINGGSLRRLTPPTLTGLQSSFLVAGTPTRIVVNTYTSQTNGTTDLYSIDLAHGSVVHLTGAIPGQRKIVSVLALRQPGQLAFISSTGDSQTGMYIQTVYTATVTGADLSPLTDQSFGTGTISDFGERADGRALLFIRGDNLPASPSGAYIYQLSLTGGGNGSLLAPPEVEVPVSRLQIGPSGTQILFVQNAALYVMGAAAPQLRIGLPVLSK